MTAKEKSDEIYNVLKQYVLKKSKYDPLYVFQSVVENKYPLIVFEKRSNLTDSISQDIYKLDKVINMNFEISVFAVNNENTNANTICEDLSQLISELFEDYYGMQGGLDAHLKNINTSNASKCVLHYSCKYNPKRNIIY